MPMSQGNVSSGPHGLVAKEFALVDNATLVKTSGLTMTRPQIGRYVFTFTVARADTKYFVQCTADGYPQLGTVKANGFTKSTTNFSVDVSINDTTNVDPNSLHVAVFE